MSKLHKFQMYSVANDAATLACNPTSSPAIDAYDNEASAFAAYARAICDEFAMANLDTQPVAACCPASTRGLLGNLSSLDSPDPAAKARELGFETPQPG